MPPPGKFDIPNPIMSATSDATSANDLFGNLEPVMIACHHDTIAIFLQHQPNEAPGDPNLSRECLHYSDKSGQNSPLAPSVEKAYYRKCIELKRRLNEVEAANDEAKIKRVRLDRAIMKMRLERAFLLDELRKRMDFNPDGSEASGDEGMATVYLCALAE